MYSSDDPYDKTQLMGPRMNVAVVRPLVDHLYDPDDISVGRYICYSNTYLEDITKPLQSTVYSSTEFNSSVSTLIKLTTRASMLREQTSARFWPVGSCDALMKTTLVAKDCYSLQTY